MTKHFCITVALLSCAAPAAAQTRPPSPWTAWSSLGASQTSGSTSYTSISGEQGVSYRGKKWQDSLQITGSYARNTYKSQKTDASGNIIGTTKRTALFRQWMTQLNTRLALDRRSYLVGRAELERDDNQAIRRRFFAATGAGVNLIANARRNLQLELAAGPLDEQDLASAHQRYTALAGLTNFAVKIGDGGGWISGNAEALRNLHAHDDNIFRGNLTASAPLTKTVALNVTYKVQYDTKPNLGIFDADGTDDVVTVAQRRNSTLAASISVTW